MATQEATIKAALTGSASWAALMTGGTFLREELVGNSGLSLDSAHGAGAFDSNGALKPTAVLTFGTERPHGDIPTIALNRSMQIWLYEQQGFANIRAAKRLALTLLHYQTVGISDSESINTLIFEGASPEFYDLSMGSRPAQALRFNLTYVRS